MRMTTIFHTRSLFSSFFSYEKGKLVLKFTTLDQVKPSILSFIVCGSVCRALLSTDQRPKWNYILSKRAIRSVLRKKTPKTSYIKEYLHTCQHWKPLKRLKRFSKKRICSFVLFFALVLVPSIVRERFLTTNHPYRVCIIFNQLVLWCTKHIEGPKHTAAYFPPEYPCVDSTLMCNFSNPSPLVPLNDTPTILRRFKIHLRWLSANIN